MATGDYCTLGEMKSYIWPDGVVPDDVNDTLLQAIVTGTSRLIDTMCKRRFWVTTADETRYFDSPDGSFLFPDIDIVSITSLATDDDGDRTYETTWATTDYDLLPANSALDSAPYSWIEVSPQGGQSFPSHSKGIKIVGKFGWSAVPAAVKEACLLQAMRLYKRRDAPLGVVSNPAGGDMRLLEAIDPDIQMILAPYRRIA